MDDPAFFNETIDYTANGYNGAGYYSGNITKTSFIYKWPGAPPNYSVQYQLDNLGWLQVADNNFDNIKVRLCKLTS